MVTVSNYTINGKKVADQNDWKKRISSDKIAYLSYHYLFDRPL